MYSLIKKLLFCLDPEKAHYLTLKSLKLAYRLGLLAFKKPLFAPCTVMGLLFPNPIGLAAGLDKNAEYVDALAALGFGFIEIGTVTPKPQSGNPKPRLFRLVKEEALINRLGFNNKGMDYVAKQLEKTNYRGILGINIGKNRDTPIENAVEDYLLGFRKFWKYASYITINISSPNTQGLRELQKSDALSILLKALKQEQKLIVDKHGKHVPLVVKISPDETEEQLKEMTAIFIEQQIDGVIATNTTIQRQPIENSAYAKEAGGLSGKPLQSYSTNTIRTLHHLLQNKIPIIGVGGIMDTASAKEKITAGASLLQIYTGLIYQGPALIKKILLT